VFSESELQLAQNKEVILTKMAVIEKVYNQFGALGEILFEFFKENAGQFQNELSILPKISRGENYLGFPWVMLDYPRFFEHIKGHFALRNFFWWGHYYLVQLQVSGKYATEVTTQLQNGLFPLKIENFHVWAGYPADPWNYQIPQEGMFELKSGYQIESKNKDAVLKIAVQIPINQFEKLIDVALALCKFCIKQSATEPVE
jgi:hypothetical protein